VIAAHHSTTPATADSDIPFRVPTQGPEYELVREYIKAQLPKEPRGQRLTVFLEPELESGFPDVVAVYWHVATVKQWLSARTQLTTLDVRLAHYFATFGESNLERLRPFFRKNISPALERLCEAEVVRKTKSGWRLRSLREVFAVRRLIAIEAKVDQWRAGLSQAFLNTWFASESYLLLSRLPKQSDLMEEARRLGVGVRTGNQDIDGGEISARRWNIPKSYASWLFNEWVWRVRDAA
jgi:hypothetical protein